MILVIVVALYAAAIILDFLPAAGADARGVRALYLTLTAVSLVFLVLHAVGIQGPSPTDFIREAVTAIFGPI